MHVFFREDQWFSSLSFAVKIWREEPELFVSSKQLVSHFVDFSLLSLFHICCCLVCSERRLNWDHSLVRALPGGKAIPGHSPQGSSLQHYKPTCSQPTLCSLFPSCLNHFTIGCSLNPSNKQQLSNHSSAALIRQAQAFVSLHVEVVCMGLL